MPTLQVRDVPEHIYRRLVDDAQKERRSLTQQAVAVLARGLEVDIDPHARMRAALDRAARIDREQTRRLPDPARLIREDRDR